MSDYSRRDEDTFEILVASDIHLGFDEENPVRGKDSFTTFNEILEVGQTRNVDFVLLGGDLFHANKPSMNSIHKCISSLRKYCMGDKPIVVEFLSEQEEVFGHCTHKVVNYEDCNLNISIPVYSIHGNHDDPSGFKCMGSMDLLAASGLINYFGKWTDYTQVKLTPLLMKKGNTKLAIYGLSHIKDERLARLFTERRVEFKRPSEDPDSWCNILVLHQNRVDRGPKNYIQESMIPDFFQLVIWGHEHECKINPQYNNDRGFYVIQPGSPVVTSLCDGESVAKHVAIVRVNGLHARVEPVALQTVRPFVFNSLKLSDAAITGTKKQEQIEAYIKETVENMLESSRSQITGNDLQPTLPLIRLRVEYSEEDEYFNPVRFGQKFTDSVANPMDMIQLKKEPAKRSKRGQDLDKEAIEQVIDQLDTPVDRESLGVQMERVVSKYFETADITKQMRILSVEGMNGAIERVISKDDKDALIAIIQHQKKKTMEYLKTLDDLDEVNIKDKLQEFQAKRKNNQKQETQELTKFLDDCVERSRIVRTSTQLEGDNSDPDMDMDMSIMSSIHPSDSVSQRPTRGPGSRGGRGSRGPSRARGARAAANTSTRASANTSTRTATNTSTRGRGRGKTSASQASLVDMFSSIESPAKKRKVVYASDSDDD